ncbi:MAG: CNNM domain-containing protein, partial [Planctomycetota bacterium]
MGYVGWAVLLMCLLAGGTLFFTVNAVALRTFSLAKLQEAFKAVGKDSESRNLAEGVAEHSEKLILTCSVFRIISNMCILLLLVSVFVDPASAVSRRELAADYALSFIVAAVFFSVFSLAIPHAWAKYAGEKILSRTYRLLALLALIAMPFLYMFKLYDSVVRRLAGIVETTPEEQHEEKQEEFLTGLEQHRTEGALDEEEQEMIENVLELSSSTADEIMTPRTDMIALEVNSDLQKVLDTIATAGHTRVPVYEENI